MAYKIIKDRPNYPFDEGDPFANFDAGEEFLFQMEKYFPSVFSFNEISKRDGRYPRREVLFEGNFILPGTSNNKFYVFVLQTESGGRPDYSTSEYRLQFRKGRDWSPKLSSLNVISNFAHNQNKENHEVYVICIHKFDVENHNVVFTGIYPQELELAEQDSYTSSKSFQFSVESIREAYLRDVSIYHKNSRGAIPLNAIHFKPQHLLWYMENRDKLHLQDISLAGDIVKKEQSKPLWLSVQDAKANMSKFLPAMRTKPFLLLAGISGTGKSQIVKEMSFATCAKNDELRKSEASPGNYCLIEVKPNWHDSTELLGYDSAIKKHYVVTKFVKFVAKAMRYPEVPFFVCLDEMNLAPVEQYFAEFLSVLESRKLVDGKIISEPLIDREYFKNNLVALDLFDLPASEYKSLPNVSNVELNDDALGENAEIWHRLQKEGMYIPQNLIVIGTVNMDETTHQFSRKVIDRAMTFEMNEADFDSYFEDKITLDYVDEPLDAALFLARNVSGNRAIEEINNLIEDFKPSVAAMLNTLNVALNDTPFKIAYRVQNELILYFAELLRENADADQEQLLATALDDMMMMKVLPRIEGDDDLLGNRSDGALHNLKEFAKERNLTKSLEKIEEMQSRLDRSHFTSFWP